MRPIQITMQAFGSYNEKTTIDFTRPAQNIFLIRGDTGAGKTTIFDAIVFALYGEASSSANRKDGAELQSQFADPSVEPYVELVFTERQGDEEKEYTVRRSPRHIRPLQRRGKGKFVDEKENVSLFMPDRTEYTGNKRETDEKIGEIVGLTKDQFMQVAMIAQGEFMELLRAKSDDKKKIFRKLFGTQLYDKIVDELQERRKIKATQIDRIRAVCQAEISHVAIPPEYEGAEPLTVMRKRLLESEKSFAADLEIFMEELGRLCSFLEESCRDAEKQNEQASAKRDAARDAYGIAETLMQFYTQLEKAERELKECEAEQAQIDAAGVLMQEIGAAYEIKADHDRFSDARKAVKAAETGLAAQKEALPALGNAAEETAQSETAARETLDAQTQHFSKVQERVKRALDVLGKMNSARIAAESARKAAETARLEGEKARKDLETLENKEQEWRAQDESLRDLGERIAVFKVKKEEAEGIGGELQGALDENKKLLKEYQAYEKLKQQYLATDAKYTAARDRFESSQKAFLDAQAGLLARTLQDGQPCPVCGSLHHPAPCSVAEDGVAITRERLSEMSQEVEKLRTLRESEAGKASTALELFKERRNAYNDMLARIGKRIERNVPGTGDKADFELLRQAFIRWQAALTEEEVVLNKEAARSRKLREQLENAQVQKQRLKEASDAAQKKMTEAGETYARSSAAYAQLKESLDFETERDAQEALKKAREQMTAAKQSFEKASAQARKAKAALDQAGALIARYEQELPGLRESAEERDKAYKAQMAAKELTEERWMEVTAAHRREEQQLLQKKIEAHKGKAAAARRAREDALKGIDGRPKPVLEDLRAARDEAEQSAAKAREALQLRMDLLRTDRNAFDRLSAGGEQRSELTRTYSRIDSLYTRLAGKVPGARMDIETYVQRYWLERILHAANLRFREMSAGQFELRMCGEENAGAGRNRGLDLMVYSNVTGREREIRTLSGGESFMAALSLALGLSDQIQAGTASVNLDIMFIDEGFGSLDNNAREQAVKVLAQMAGSDRMIGIISHVTELGQEIEDQLVVTRDDTGSHVKWELS